jgi:hypothetical protein
MSCVVFLRPKIWFFSIKQVCNWDISDRFLYTLIYLMGLIFMLFGKKYFGKDVEGSTSNFDVI